ncbi:TPA: BppU family phage baseplate upper protein [Enterococcus faecium]
MVYKMNESIIVIQAEATSPIRTNVVFWSHDRGTAKLKFKLMKNNLPLPIPDGTTVPIRLMFKSATAEGGYGKHDYLATVEDPVNGIVSIVLEDNILGYVGTVEGSVYIDFPNDRSLDTAGRFTFYIKRSPIDDSTPELEDYYFNGFSQTIDKIEKILADGKQEIEQKITESETQIDAKLKDTSNKITKANQDVATINTNIDKANDRIDQTNQNLNEMRNGMKLYEAWAWSKDGTDRFTTVYPGENYVLKSKDGYTAAGNGGSNQYPAAINSIPLNPDILGKDATIQYKLTISNYESGSFVVLKLYNAVGVWASFGGNSMISGNGTWLIQWKGTLPPLKENGLSKVDFNTNLKADILIEELQIKEGTEYQIYTPAPSEDYANAYPTYKGISIVDSNNPNDYSWDITPEYTEKGLNDSVSLTEPQSVDGTKNFLETPLVNGKNVLVEEKPLPYEAWHSTGTEQTGISNKARLIIGPVATTIGAKLNRSMKENPLTWNSGNWQATANRDCTLLVEGLVRYQFGGSTAGQYGYITFYKDDAQTSSIGFAGGVGINETALQWKHGLHFSRIFALKKGEYFNITFETQDGKKLDFSQINTLHIMEIES